MSVALDELRELIYRSCVLLDCKDYDGWLALCAPTFRYSITAKSPEIRKDMVWLDHDRSELETLFANLHLHVVVPGDYRRHVGMSRETSRSNNRIKMESSVLVFHTTLEGASSLFAIATYRDVIGADGKKALFYAREVRMETRQLPFGPHVIL